jgi:hypothetical protein
MAVVCSTALIIKNTFLEFDEREATGKLRRVSSAPAEFHRLRQVLAVPESKDATSTLETEASAVFDATAAVRDASSSDSSKVKSLRVDEPSEEQQLAPARKRARVVSGEDSSGIRSTQPDTEQCEDHNPESERGRTKTRGRSSRSQPRLEGGTVCNYTEQERLDKAQDWVRKMKETPGYAAYLDCRQAGDKEALAAPRTPDPSLRVDSKRKWERAIMVWRISLRKWGPVNLSTEDEI